MTNEINCSTCKLHAGMVTHQDCGDLREKRDVTVKGFVDKKQFAILVTALTLIISPLYVYMWATIRSDTTFDVKQQAVLVELTQLQSADGRIRAIAMDNQKQLIIVVNRFERTLSAIDHKYDLVVDDAEDTKAQTERTKARVILLEDSERDQRQIDRERAYREGYDRQDAEGVD